MFGLLFAASAATVCTDGCDYTDLVSAIASVEAKETITLNGDVTLNDKVVVTKEITLDLNGNNITGNGQYVLEFNAKDTNFTLTDSTDTAGTITGTQRGILVTSGNLTLDKVTVTSADRTIQINPVTDGGVAKVIVEGGKIESTGTNATRTIMLWGNNVAGEASLVVNGGTIKANGEYRKVALAREDGTDDTGAAISITSNAAFNGGVSVIINGGTLESANGNALYEGISVDETDTPAATESYVSNIAINGGTFTSAQDKDSVVAAAYPEEKFISGGTFNSDVTNHLTSDLKLVADENGNYVVESTVTENPDIENPSTSDNVLTYAIIGLVSLVGIAGSAIYLKKHKEN